MFAMPASRRRKQERNILGANRKGEWFWWIGCWVVRIQLRSASSSRSTCALASTRLTCEKAEHGAEKSFRDPRKRLRGQRRGKKRSRGGKPRLNSSLRPSKPNRVSDRRINHTGRKFIWCRKAVNVLWRKDCFIELEESARPYFGGAKRLDKVLTSSGNWRHCRNVLSPFVGRAKAMGVPASAAFERDLWTFIQVNSPAGGDFFAFMSHVREALRPPVPPSEAGPHDQSMKRRKWTCRGLSSCPMYQCTSCGWCRGCSPEYIRCCARSPVVPRPRVEAKPPLPKGGDRQKRRQTIRRGEKESQPGKRPGFDAWLESVRR